MFEVKKMHISSNRKKLNSVAPVPPPYLKKKNKERKEKAFNVISKNTASSTRSNREV